MYVNERFEIFNDIINRLRMRSCTSLETKMAIHAQRLFLPRNKDAFLINSLWPALSRDPLDWACQPVARISGLPGDAVSKQAINFFLF